MKPTLDRFVVVGGGGHAKVVIATIEAAGGKVERVLDDNPALHGTRIFEHVIHGPVTDALIPEGTLAIVAIGMNSARQAVAARLHAQFGTVVHPSAIVHKSAALGTGSVVFAGAVLQPGVQVGRHVVVNTAVSIDHDCVLQDFVHLAPGVHLAGNVKLGEGAFMGIGSCAIPGSRVGEWATVGAGGVVVGVIPQRTTAIGVPARTVERRRR